MISKIRLSISRPIILIVISVILCSLHKADSQNVTNLRVVNDSDCFYVVVDARIDPVSDTYTFDWGVNLQNGTRIELVLVGLNGRGIIGQIDQGSPFRFIVRNNPSTLPNSNNPFNSTLTFNYSNEANTNLRFSIVSTPLDVATPTIVNQPRCSETLLCGITRSFTCSNGQKVLETCDIHARYSRLPCPPDFPTTGTKKPTTTIPPPSPNGNQTIGIIFCSIGGFLCLVGIVFLIVWCVNEKLLFLHLFPIFVGIGFLFVGVGLILWRPAEVGFLVGGIILILVGLGLGSFFGYIIYKEKQSKGL